MATEWEMSSSLIKDILEIVPHGSTILELGSGSSTDYLSKFYKMISIEHDEQWVGKYNSTYIYAPKKEYKPTKHFGNDNLWYDASVLRAELPKLTYNAFIVDGPKGSRVGLWKYKELFNWNVPVFFDDYQRDSVKRLVRLLCGKYGINKITVGDVAEVKQYAFFKREACYPI